jgi:signal recognition particle subunit SEC65
MKTSEIELFLTKNHEAFWADRVTMLSKDLADAQQSYAGKGLRNSSALMIRLKEICERAFDDALVNYLAGINRAIKGSSVKPTRRLRTAIEVAVYSMLASIREELNAKLAMQPGFAGPRNQWNIDGHVELSTAKANKEINVIFAESKVLRKSASKSRYEGPLWKLILGIAVTVLGALLFALIRAHVRL